MQYQKFIIEKYKAVNSPITINIHDNSFFCIIGENECGKSTILQGIYSFDYSNDDLTQGVHLKDVGNLYNIADNNTARIKAVISIADHKKEVFEIIKQYHSDAEEVSCDLLNITRLINGKTVYAISELENETDEVQDLVAKEIINRLPRIIYFDDFTDPLPNKINLEDEQFMTWINVVDLLIRSIEPESSVTIDTFLNEASPDNLIKSICASMAEKLNNTIVRQWKEIRLENEGINFEIEVDYDRSTKVLEFKLIEKINGHSKRYFDIRQRSKGFYWFFNFVMRTEFNPKGSFGNQSGAIFLFDEPGAYLHVSMQNTLCEKLKILSDHNIVVYCTHSPELIEYDTIDKTWICYRDMNKNGNILLNIAEDFYTSEAIDENRKQIIIEPLINKSIIHDLYNLGNDKNGKFKGTLKRLEKAGSVLYEQLKDVATTTAAKTINEAMK